MQPARVGQPGLGPREQVRGIVAQVAGTPVDERELPLHAERRLRRGVEVDAHPVSVAHPTPIDPAAALGSRPGFASISPVSETRELTLTLDFSLRVGDLLLSSGAGAADVAATMLSLARALGASQAEVDVTFTALTMSHQGSPEEWPLIATRHVHQRVIDYQDLTRVDHLVRAVLREEIDLAGARAELRQITSTGHDRPRWAVTLGWGVMSAGVGVQLGGDWLVVLLAAVAAMSIDRLQMMIARRRIPAFYQQVAGGGVATLIAVGRLGDSARRRRRSSSSPPTS